MKFLLATLPDETAEQARWLEEHLLGLDLAGVVAELKALGRHPVDDALGLDAALGDVLPEILDSGLCGQSADTIRQLLKHPELLLQLQTRIFLEGGDYWNQLPEPSPEVRRAVDRGLSRLNQFLDAEARSSGSTRRGATSTGSTSAGTTTSPAPTKRNAWIRHPLLVSLATAAAVMAAVFVTKPFPASAPTVPVAQGWGWNRPGAIDGSIPAQQYLGKLSDAADDWFKKRPATPDALARRILEFRQGCSTLILAEHRPLKPEDKTWLIEKCQAWAKKLDQHLADVEAGKDVLEVRQQADETVNKLKKALKDRSETA